MITVKLHQPIGNESNAWWYMWDGFEGVFSLEFVQKLLSDNPSETDFRFDIHCPGGEVDEGLAIYDCLRTSGRNIHMNVEGGCHSMAVVLLLAAPKENRTANPNCRALIHKVQSGAWGSVDDLEAAAHDARAAQDAILDIYAERTGTDRETLRRIMDEEKERTAQELLQWGFISKINSYNTNYKSRMAMAKNLKERAADFMKSLTNFIGGVTNFEFVDSEGQVLFTTEAEDDSLKVGMAASPDGTFTIADGRTVTIADGEITEIQEPAPEENEPTEQEVADLRAENETLRSRLSEAADIIRDYQRQVRSNYVPQQRMAPQTRSGNGSQQTTSEERKNAVRENIEEQRKKKE